MTERNHEIARYIRISDEPEELSREQLIAELERLAEYASKRVSECHALRNVIANAMGTK